MNEIIEFLKQTEPFDKLPPEALPEVSGRLEHIKYPNAESLFYEQHKTPVLGMDILIKGNYEIFFYGSTGKKEYVRELKRSDYFGAFSILHNNGISFCSVNVQKGTEVYRLPSDYLQQLCRSHEAFNNAFLSAFGHEMLNSNYAAYVTRRDPDIDAFNFDRYFIRRLDAINMQSIVTCSPDTPCHDAARLMEEHRISYA